MSNTLIELKERASHLSDRERAEFALSLLTSLDDHAVEHDVDAAWQVEIARRVGAIQRGEVDLVAGADVFSRIQQRIG